MNKADSERLGALLEGLGYLPAAIDEADLIVLNSCVVRQSAEDRLIGKLGSLRSMKRSRPELIIALTGCMVDSHVDELKRRFPHVDFFFKPQAFDDLILPLARSRGVSIDGMGHPLPTNPPPSTLVPIIKGCDNFCSYCIVPYRRGRERSRPLSEVIAEVQELTRRGAREVTLLGQRVTSYGRDLEDKPDLADLLYELDRIEGLVRIRFLTSFPRDVSRRLIEAIARLDKVCEQISLPVQAGDDDILRAMRRGYTVEEYRQLISEIRCTIPGVAISTDVIVGFPGEGDRQFEHTLDLLEELRFDVVHTACYSPRPGTIASRKLSDDVPLDEKRRRREKIEEFQEAIASEINLELLNQKVEILVEGRKRGRWWGRTRTNKLVFLSDESDHLGQLVKVRIEETSPWSLKGKVVG